MNGIPVYSIHEDPDVVIKQAITIYKEMEARLEATGEKLAPIEVKKGV